MATYQGTGGATGDAEVTAAVTSTQSATGGVTADAFAAAAAAATTATAPAVEDLPMGDFRMVWGDFSADLVLSDDDDLTADQGLRTSVLLSLFTDRRALEDDDIPTGDGDLRGWWADQFAETSGDLIGSRLWLLARAKLTPDVLPRVVAYSQEALQWLLDDGIVDLIEYDPTLRDGVLWHVIRIYRPEIDPVEFRFAHVWNVEAAITPEVPPPEPPPPPPEPDEIFGANLDGWWRADAGVATIGSSPVRVDEWTSQAVNARVADAGSNRPRYIASDTDGTPSIDMNIADNPIQYFSVNFASPALSIRAEFTCWTFCKPYNDTQSKKVMHSPFSSHHLYAHRNPNKYPGQQSYNPFQADVLDWAVIRFNGHDVANVRTVCVDDRPQLSGSSAWATAGKWQNLFGDSASDGTFLGLIKELVVVDGYHMDGSSEHLAVLAYFKAKYSSLVSY